ncbi:MAG: GtrA family protein [Rubrivivax sp.]|nr:MAG: GtrA family protein [Rubrivivax sp.]
MTAKACAVAKAERLPRGPVGFVLVGMAAAAVHYGVALTLHGRLGLAPAWANPLAFGAAFPISYVGHRRWSFPGDLRPHAQALPRFMAVAMSGFLGNQALLLMLLRLGAWPFWLAMGVTLVSVALGTYLLSRHWAFG